MKTEGNNESFFEIHNKSLLKNYGNNRKKTEDNSFT